MTEDLNNLKDYQDITELDPGRVSSWMHQWKNSLDIKKVIIWEKDLEHIEKAYSNLGAHTLYYKIVKTVSPKIWVIASRTLYGLQTYVSGKKFIEHKDPKVMIQIAEEIINDNAEAISLDGDGDGKRSKAVINANPYDMPGPGNNWKESIRRFSSTDIVMGTSYTGTSTGGLSRTEQFISSFIDGAVTKPKKPKPNRISIIGVNDGETHGQLYIHPKGKKFRWIDRTDMETGWYLEKEYLDYVMSGT